MLPFASKLYLWQGIYAPHAYVTQEIAPENGIARVLCFPLSLLPFLACIFFSIFAFTLSLVRTLSVNNDGSCCSVTLSRISCLNFPLPRQTCREEFWVYESRYRSPLFLSCSNLVPVLAISRFVARGKKQRRINP